MSRFRLNQPLQRTTFRVFRLDITIDEVEETPEGGGEPTTVQQPRIRVWYEWDDGAIDSITFDGQDARQKLQALNTGAFAQNGGTLQQALIQQIAAARGFQGTERP